MLAGPPARCHDPTMAAFSAGILPYSRDDAGLWVFVVHMGGPFWTRKDAASW